MVKCCVCGKNVKDEYCSDIYKIGTDEVEKICYDCMIKQMEMMSERETEALFC